MYTNIADIKQKVSSSGTCIRSFEILYQMIKDLFLDAWCFIHSIWLSRINSVDMFVSLLREGKESQSAEYT